MDPSLDATLSDVLAANSVLENQAAVQQHVQEVSEVSEQHVQQNPTPPPRTKGKSAAASAGSSADARRREANRLAAERSRNRQHEKIIALEMAVQALGDENLKLKEEIERLEGREDGGANHDMPAGDQTGTTVADVEAATAAAINAADTHNQQGNLLAALLSSSGSNIDELTATLDPESEQSWMRGVESLFKDEVDVSGRLGELAAVAAGQDGDGNNDQASQGHTPTGDALSDGSRSRGGSVYGPTLPTLATSSASAVAVAINAEMEKMLRDDIAKTKAAIARVERELTRARGQPVYDDGANDESIPLSATIPKEVLEADAQTLLNRSEEIKTEMANAESEAAVLREVISRMRDAHAEDEQKLDNLVSELKELEMDGGERERDQIAGLLRGLRAHVTTRMNAPGGDFHAGPLMTPFASPATARRKRGRPPKQAALPAKYVYSLMYSSPLQTPGGSPDGAGEGSGSSSTRAARSFSRGRSRLANEIRLDNEAGPSSAVDNSQATAHDDYLLSHLTQAADGGRDAQIPLDSTSFAAFLPPSPHDPSVTPSQPTTMEHALSAPTQTAEEVVQEPNILSRLRRGPPGSCEVCGRTHTSVWRKLTFHGEDLKVCNACGLYHAKFGILRPHELWGDGKSVKKRKAASRGSVGYDANGAKRKRKSDPLGPMLDDGQHQQLDQQMEQHEIERQIAQHHHEQQQQQQQQAQAHQAQHDTPDMDMGVGAELQEGGEHQHEHPSLGEVGRAVENMFAAAGQV